MEEKVSEELCNALTGEEDSGRILNKLQEEGAFLYRQNDGSYRFHNLFREFLKDIFSDRPEEYRVRQIRTAGKWYQEQKDYYHAIERFVSIQDYEEIIYCFRSLKDMGRAGFDPERVAHDIHIALNEDIAQQYPWLYSLMAYTARNEGRMQDFRNYLDCYYRNYPRVVEQAPERVHEIFFLYMMDSRYSLHDIFKMSADAQVHGAFQGAQGCVTLYFPLYHRSFRDFSELLPGDIDGKIHLYRATLGRLLGEERDMIVECIRSGLYYEQGMLDRAKEAALLALSRLEKGFTPESKFCAMVLLLVINHALGEYGAEKSMQEDIQKMIEEDKAFYLQYNFDAVLLRSRMDFQDTRAAEEWLETRAGEMYGRVYGTLDFFRLYGHFTTARAYIVLGNFDQAVILLEKILEMCRPLKRPRSRSNTSRHLPLMPVWLNIHCAA